MISIQGPPTSFLERAVLQRVKEGRLSNTEGSKVIEFYEDQVESYTYLTPNGKEK